MTTQSPFRRRAGALLVGAGALLLPLTASFSYAQDREEAPLPPTPPAAPTAALPPAPPEAPLPPEAVERRVVVREIADAGDGDKRRVIVIRRDKDGKHVTVDKDGKKVRREFRIVRPDGVHTLDDKALEKEMAELGIRMGKLGEEMGDLAVIDAEKLGKLHAKRFRVDRMAPLGELRVPTIEMKCDGDGPVSDTTSPDGKRVIRVCRSFGQGHAAMSLRAARDQIARQGGMNEDTRQDVLRSLDREIERLEAAKDAPGK